MVGYVFFLGGSDAEMVEIKNILKARGAQFYDKKLAWGASLSVYKEEIDGLSTGKIPVFVELDLDCTYPVNAIIVDHHSENAGKDKATSIEQIANLLEIKLDRRQELISANDKGHIRAMRRLCATDEEISEIRKLDRYAQGVTEEDEQLAEKSIETLVKIGDDCAIAYGLTSHSSAMVDRIYDKYKHIFVYPPDKSKMSYFGDGQVVCKLINIYKEKTRDNPSIEFWSGGELPEYGYFGTNLPLDKGEIEALIDGKSIISQHLFLFPFTITPHERDLNIHDIYRAFTDSGWRYKPYNPTESASNYSEYFYFHQYVRDAIFGTASQETVEDGFKSGDARAISYTFERDISDNANMMLHVKVDDDYQKFSLSIKGISLRLFELGIGILEIELLNYDYPLADDILLINDYGRRIYPQYLSDNDGIERVKNNFLADRIEFQYKGDPIDQCLSFNTFFKKDLVVADYIQELLGEEFLNKFKITPTIDDRMFTVCWYRNDCLSSELKEKDEETKLPGYRNSDIWYKFIFIDGKSIGCFSKEMKASLIEKSTYPRWVGYGTFFGISRYSLVCISDTGWFQNNILREHLRRHYRYLATIALAQRASILKFSAEIARISSSIKSLVENGYDIDNAMNANVDETAFEDIARNVKKLDASFIRFVNRLWFTEVTPQEQGIEMYDMLISSMGLKSQLEELKAEMKELREFVNLSFEERNTKKNTQINDDMRELTGFALPVTALVAFFTVLDFVKSPLSAIKALIIEEVKGKIAWNSVLKVLSIFSPPWRMVIFEATFKLVLVLVAIAFSFSLVPFMTNHLYKRTKNRSKN